MKKCLFIVIALLLFSSLLGLQRCTICHQDRLGKKRPPVAATVQEDTFQESEAQESMALNDVEREDVEEQESVKDSCREGTSLDFLRKRCQAPYPHIVAENPYVVQPYRITSFKAFQKDRDYETEYAVDFHGKSSPDYVFSGDMLFRTSLLTRGDSLLLENPALEVIPTEQPGKVIMETAYRCKNVDFMSGQLEEDLLDFDRRDAHFPRFIKDYHTSISFEGQQTIHSFTLDFPDESVAYRKNICRWLSRLVSESYVGDPEMVDSVAYQASRQKHPERWRYSTQPVTASSLGQFSSSRYFAFKKMQYSGPLDAYSYLISVYDWRLCLRNDRFLTYQQYIFDFDGGMHGSFCSSLRSFDFVHQEEVDLRYLFRPECLDSVKGLLLDEASCSEIFLRKERIETLEQLYFCFARSAATSRSAVIANMQLPVPGLSEEGVVFSYPPYSIGAYNSGDFHFVIPYGRLLPYLTPKAKWCLNLH